MPKITEYTDQVGGLRPTEAGINAISGAARRVQAGYNEQAEAVTQAGARMGKAIGGGIEELGQQVVKFAEHREVAAGAANYAKLNDALTERWNDTASKADPNDPTTAVKFREEVLEPALEKYRDSFNTEGGQKFAEARVDSLRNHLFQKTAADMSSLAATAVSKNVHETANEFSNTAMRDPSAVPHLLEGIDASISGIVDSSPNIKGPDAAKARIALSEKMRESIVKAGAIGAIAKSSDPERTAQEWGEKYSKYISGDELKMLGANARQQIRADRTDRAYADHLKKQDEIDRSDKVETGYLQKLYSDDPKDRAAVSTKEVVNNPNLIRTAKERLINIVNREMKPETDTRISARTSVDIMRTMQDPNSDPDKVMATIMEARAKDPGSVGSLTKADFNDLQKQLVDRKTPQGMALAQDRAEFFKRFAPTIDPSMGDVQSMQFGHHTALGNQKMYEAEKAARRMEDDLKRQGKDPHGLYDPSSPDFFGKPANIMKYRASLQDSVNYQKQLGQETVTGVQVIDLPKGMTPTEAAKNYKSGTKIRLPDGRTGTVP